MRLHEACPVLLVEEGGLTGDPSPTMPAESEA